MLQSVFPKNKVTLFCNHTTINKLRKLTLRVWWWWLVASDFCKPMDCSPSGSSVHGISQARMLEWVAISFSMGSSWPPGGQGLNSHLLYCRQILYQLSNQGSLKLLSNLWTLFKTFQCPNNILYNKRKLRLTHYTQLLCLFGLS